MYRSVPTSVLTRGPHSYRGRELGYPPSEPKNRGGFYGGMRDKMPLKSSFETQLASDQKTATGAICIFIFASVHD